MNEILDYFRDWFRLLKASPFRKIFLYALAVIAILLIIKLATSNNDVESVETTPLLELQPAFTAEQ